MTELTRTQKLWLTLLFVVVCGASFTVSAATLISVAHAGGIEPAWLIPVVVDVAMIAASISILQQGTSALARTILIATAGLSVAVNAWHGWENAPGGPVEHWLNVALGVAPPALVLAMTELVAQVWHVDPDRAAKAAEDAAARAEKLERARAARERESALAQMRAQAEIGAEQMRLASAGRALALALEADEAAAAAAVDAPTTVVPRVVSAPVVERAAAPATVPARAAGGTPRAVGDAERTAELLRLVFDEGLSATSAAQQAGVPASTAKRHVRAERDRRDGITALVAA